jgi:hypothetical protein
MGAGWLKPAPTLVILRGTNYNRPNQTKSTQVIYTDGD